MATIVTIKPNTDFQPLSAGYHNGTFTAVEVRDFEQSNYNTGTRETVTKLVITFVSETDPEVNGGPAEGRLFLRLAYGSKAHLTVVRERLLGRELTPEEAVNVDDQEFLGKRIRVQVKQKVGKNGRVYGNLDPTSITSLDGFDVPRQNPVATTPEVGSTTPEGPFDTEEKEGDLLF